MQKKQTGRQNERGTEGQADRQMEQSGDTQCIFSPPLTRALKVSKMKQLSQNLQVPLFPLADSPPHLFVFFSLSLFLSLSLSSPSIVSLIGRQTACKCSNPEKSLGALVIGCALQHCSQSIKARWAPVNSFSLLLLWLWYCHIDSNFALNPSTTAPSSPLSTFPFIFKAPSSLTLLPLKDVFTSPTLCLPLLALPLFFSCNSYSQSHLEPLLPLLTLSCHP